MDVGNINTYTSNGEIRSKRSPLEVDFIAGRGNQKVYIQSAYRMDDEEKIRQEKRPFLEIRTSWKHGIEKNEWKKRNGGRERIVPRPCVPCLSGEKETKFVGSRKASENFVRPFPMDAQRT